MVKDHPNIITEVQEYLNSEIALKDLEERILHQIDLVIPGSLESELCHTLIGGIVEMSDGYTTEKELKARLANIILKTTTKTI